MVNGSLTEVELLRLENFALKHANLQQAIQQNLAARTKYIQGVEAAHPGYQWNEPSGGLVRMEEQP